ncbi:MAG: serine hydrolase domain-containing protein [Rhodoferax sp.]
MQRRRVVLGGAGLLLPAGSVAWAAPDEEALGSRRGYPVGSASNWFYDESVRVGSFTAQADIPGLFGGRANVLAPSATPMPLARTVQEPAYRWGAGMWARNLSLDDYLARQRVMGLLIAKDGVVQAERYQYGRTPQHRFLSNSMAKSITSLGIGIALGQGRIRSIDDPAQAYTPVLEGTLYGQTRIRHLLQMASGARFVEDYSARDDLARFTNAANRGGVPQAARLITERAYPAGEHFNYSSAETEMLALVLQGATGRKLSDYLGEYLWAPMGAETSALWRADRSGLERAAGNFNATLQDYARLGILLANNGVRPDDPAKTPIIPRDYLLDATDWHRTPTSFRPGHASSYYGYGYQFWLFPGEKRRFALLGVYGQMIFVDPGLQLVMVHLGANATPQADRTSLAREADALWRALVRHYRGSW